jgi:predicted amidohydrolase YtcJ
MSKTASRLSKVSVMPKSSMERRHFIAGAAAAAVSGLAGSHSAAQSSPPRTLPTPLVRPADIVLKNGKVLTVDGTFTIAQAIAITADKIIAVGANDAMTAHISAQTRVIDLKGKTVVPGLIDGHAHMDREALRNVFPSLGRVRSIRDIQDQIAELARGKRSGEWIVTMPIGDPPFYFDVPDILAEKRWPTRQDLDAAAPNNPVYIRSIWGFWRGTFPLVSCANTEALKRAGITRNTISPVETLTIQKDGNGDPTGVFIEQEFQPVAELVWFREATRFSHTDRVRALPQSARMYNSVATTSVFEGHGVATELLKAYKEVHGAGDLTVRATLTISPNWKAADNAPLGALVEGWAGWLAEPGLGDDWLKMSGLFALVGRSPADNVRGAAAPYTGWAGFNSDAGLPRDQLRQVLLNCAANNIRVAAITGTAGLSTYLDLYEEVHRQISLRGRRWVLAHIAVISPREIERIARMDLVLTTHTNSFLYKMLDATADQLPAERHDDIVPLNALREAGVTVSLATDNAPISLWGPVQQTIVRRDFKSQRMVGAKQALSRVEALRCATVNGAYLTFDEDKKGTLQPGKLADLTVLSADPLTVEETKIAEIASQMTMVGGTIVHESSNWSL